MALLSATLLAIAASVSGWMSWRGRGGRWLPGCGAGSSCEAVTHGRWSRVGPLPVSLLGMVLYAMLLTLSTMIAAGNNAAPIRPAALALSTTAAAAAVWFFFLQLVVVRRFCFYCSATHLCALVAAACMFFRVPVVGSTVLLSGVGTGLFAVGCLILGQILIEPKLYAVISTQMKIRGMKISRL